MGYAVEVTDVTMVYNLASEKINHLKEYIIKASKRQLKFDKFMALQNISFNVNKGDVFGIVGLNGSGKSTLLKIISGIISPTKGVATTNGVIAPLIELGAGFDPELTGRENIFLNGSVLGFSKKYMQMHFEEIVDFSEIHEFIDVPMKNYSSGMYARLGFSVATLTKPDILILDEVLAVGDFKFQEKCEQRIADMMSGGTTVLIVSHSIDQIRRMCNNALWLEKGRIKGLGTSDEICKLYGEAYQ